MIPERYAEDGEATRWPINTPIQVYIREDFPHLAGHTVDISVTGLHIEIGIKLPIRSIVILEIYFQRSNVFDFIEQEPLRLRGQVIWRKPVSEEDYDIWSTGLSFVEVTEEQQEVIYSELQMIEGGVDIGEEIV